MMSNVTSAIMGDPVRTPKPEPPRQSEPTAAVKWWKPVGRNGAPSVTVNKKSELLLNAPLREALGGGTDEATGKKATLYVRIGLLESGELVIERTDAKNPMARKVMSTGQVGGGDTKAQCDSAGFVPGRYPARVNQQGTVALVKKP